MEIFQNIRVKKTNMKLSLEKVNKYLIFFALISLIWRINSFIASHIPNPFEILWLIIVAVALIDVVKNKKNKRILALDS